MKQPNALEFGTLSKTLSGCIIYTALPLPTGQAPYGAVAEAVEVIKLNPNTPLFIWFGASHSTVPCPTSPQDTVASLGARWEQFRKDIGAALSAQGAKQVHQVFVDAFTAPAEPSSQPEAEQP